MGYDISLRHPETGSVLTADEPHQIRGGTYAIGGTEELWLKVTYNYAGHFQRVLGEDGIRSIYGLTGAESIPILDSAIAQLKDDVNPSDDYWAATEGNVKRALESLRELALMGPHGVWYGD